MTLTAARQVYVMLRDAGHAGVHSLTIRQTGTSGNPSQRLREIAAHGVDVRKRREPIGRRPGIRAWLGEFAPSDAVPVQPDADHTDPNGDPGLGGEPSDPPLAAEPRVERGWVRDYTDPNGTWHLEAA